MKLLAIILYFGFTMQAQAEHHSTTKIESLYSVEQTVTNLQKILRAKKFTIFATVDHAKGAKDAGMKLEPNTLIIFGNPKVGTPLMQANPETGIDLPVKYHVFERAKKVYVSYNSPDYLAKRHRLDPHMKPLKKMTKALKAMATKAAGKS